MNILLENIRQYEVKAAQKTPEWFEARKTKLTASMAASFVYRNESVVQAYKDQFPNSNVTVDETQVCSPYVSNAQAIKNKLTPSFTPSIACDWGNKYEDLAIQYFESEHHKKVESFGLITHPTIPYLAASPDGICDDGLVIEIKCPYSRSLTNNVPLLYWIQIQFQLEVFQLKHALFIDCKVVEYAIYGEWGKVRQPVKAFGAHLTVFKDGKQANTFLSKLNPTLEEAMAFFDEYSMNHPDKVMLPGFHVIIQCMQIPVDKHEGFCSIMLEQAESFHKVLQDKKAQDSIVNSLENDIEKCNSL